MSNNHDLHDERISKLYKMGGNSEPPVHIDNDIKRAARADIPNRWRSYAWPSMATAAVLVLSISLVLKVLNQQPLEESVMKTMPADGRTIAPTVRLQESKEKAAKTRDNEKKMLERKASTAKFRAINQSVAPAPSETEEAAHFEAAPAKPDELSPRKKRVLKRDIMPRASTTAPAMNIDQDDVTAPKSAIGEVQSSPMQKLDCSGITLPDSDSSDLWIKLHHNAMKQGQLSAARCLKRAYQARFNQTIPEVSE